MQTSLPFAMTDCCEIDEENIINKVQRSEVQICTFDQ